MALFLIISLNVKITNANIENYMDFGDLNNKNLQMRSVSVPDQSDDQGSANVSEEQIQGTSQEVIADSKSFDINGVPLDLPVIDQVVGKRTKRYSSRFCGSRLMEAILRICNGCVKPIGSKLVEHKRCKLKFSFQFITIFI
ncbi:unnamed protein product [Onchocerca flexuosa]|uniref:Uncharacterized protein n=1 Tax=Onchocerca flexuosa TaxID=387005 RepID=A0A183HQZ6_9BILA|nr:unnamed protein product [Onchocerca flexuosa]